MTKYEWESELKRNIVHKLPKSEQQRIMEYYNELFEDKIESGYTETQIIAEFGSPRDAADKILAEYDETDSETRISARNTAVPPDDEIGDDSTTVQTGDRVGRVSQSDRQPSEKPSSARMEEKKKTGLSAAFLRAADTFFAVLAKLVTAVGKIVAVTVGVALWIAVASVILAGWALLLGGVICTVAAAFYFGANAAGAAANVGAGLVVIGVGALVAGCGGRLIKKCVRATGPLFGKKPKATAEI